MNMLSSISKTTTTRFYSSFVEAIKDNTTVAVDTILSDKNRQRCLECMKRAPPIGIKLPKVENEKNFAAVLIPLVRNTTVDGYDEVSILYTRRSGLLSRHMHQISFPGGIKDPTDVNYIDCALRETEEEIGLPRSKVQVWGTTSLIKPPHTAAIMPVIGLVNDLKLQELHLNKREVEEAFTIPLFKLVDPAAFHYTQFRSGYSSPVFVVGPYRVWGITGFLTNTFLNCLVPLELRRERSKVKFVKPYSLSR